MKTYCKVVPRVGRKDRERYHTHTHKSNMGKISLSDLQMSGHTRTEAFDENTSHYSGDSKNTAFCHGIKLLLILIHPKIPPKGNEYSNRPPLPVKISLSRLIAKTQMTSTQVSQALFKQHVQDINIISPPRTSLTFPAPTSYPS